MKPKEPQMQRETQRRMAEDSAYKEATNSLIDNHTGTPEELQKKRDANHLEYSTRMMAGNPFGHSKNGAFAGPVSGDALARHANGLPGQYHTK